MSDKFPDRARETGPALERFTASFCGSTSPWNAFPRSQKFLLGNRIQSMVTDLLEAPIDTTYTRRWNALLIRANMGIKLQARTPDRGNCIHEGYWHLLLTRIPR